MDVKKIACFLSLCSIWMDLSGDENRTLNAPVSISSALFGFHGEEWVVGGRLPDFSYAGYHRGDDQIPERAADVFVTTFGAVGDGITDDSAAFQKAIDSSHGKVIYIPAGKYKITKQLKILGQSGTVLKGAGRDLTTLFFPYSLEQIFPGTNKPYPGSQFGLYHGYGGVILMGGRADTKAAFVQKSVGTVTANANQGSTNIVVSNGAALRLGEDYIIAMGSSNTKLPSYLLAGDLTSFTMASTGVQACFVVKAISITGNHVTIDRPLPFDISTTWISTIFPAKMGCEECGIEDLTIDFGRAKFAPPEPGYNALLVQYTHNNYFRRLRIRNSDNAINLRGCYNTTLDDIIIESNGIPKNYNGHFGIFFNLSFDNLAQNILFKTTFQHGLSMFTSHLNVCKNSSGQGGGGLTIDHRGAAPTRNLFSNIVASIPFSTSGNGATDGPKSGQYETYWNVQGVTSNWPTTFGKAPKNIVGASKGTTSRGTLWYEVIPSAQLTPKELHSAQLSLRKP